VTPIEKLLGRGHEDPAWRAMALCGAGGQDPDMWYAERGTVKSGALSTCQLCPVSPSCLLDALRHELEAGVSVGIWGGTEPRYRKRMLRGGSK